jgi:hypothetical protein
VNLLNKIVRLRNGTMKTRRSPEELERLTEVFMHQKEQRHLPIIWWTPVYPRRKTAFLIQLLLCEGSFETEYELMLQGDLKSAYSAAGLLDNDNPKQSYIRVMSTFVLKHLRVLHGGTFQFDRNLVKARAALRELFLDVECSSPLV